MVLINFTKGNVTKKSSGFSRGGGKRLRETSFTSEQRNESGAAMAQGGWPEGSFSRGIPDFWMKFQTGLVILLRSIAQSTMPRKVALVYLCIILVLVGQLSPLVSGLRRKNRSFGNSKLSLFNPLIFLDEEDQRELGKAGHRYAQRNKIVARNPILLIPGTTQISQKTWKKCNSWPHLIRFGRLCIGSETRECEGAFLGM